MCYNLIFKICFQETTGQEVGVLSDSSSDSSSDCNSSDSDSCLLYTSSGYGCTVSFLGCRFQHNIWWAVATLAAYSVFKEYKTVFSSLKCSTQHDTASNHKPHQVKTGRGGKDKVCLLYTSLYSTEKSLNTNFFLNFIEESIISRN